MNMKTYVVIMTQGLYDEYQAVVIYAGTDEDVAFEVAKTKKYDSRIEGNAWVSVQIWYDGVKMDEICIRDYDKLLI